MNGVNVLIMIVLASVEQRTFHFLRIGSLLKYWKINFYA